MTTLPKAALGATLLSLAVAQTATAAVTPPPTDAVRVDVGNGCPPGSDYPCDPLTGVPVRVTYDQTYPGRLIGWAEGLPAG